MKLVQVHAGSVELEIPVPEGVPPEVAALLPKTVSFEVKLEDVDKDGDADLVLYVAGRKQWSMQASTLADNVKAEFKRTPKNIKKLVKKVKK